MPPTYDYYPLLYAEMFAFSMAAADLSLRHNLLKGLYTGCMTQWPHTHDMSETDALSRSALHYIDTVDNGLLATEHHNGPSSCFKAPLKPPPFLHYCARYSFQTPKGGNDYHFFAKRRVDHDVLNCHTHDGPFMPFSSSSKEKMEGGSKEWNVLAVCAVERAINFAKNSVCHNR